MEDIKPPSRVKGMKILQKGEFDTTYLVPAVKIENERIKKFLQENKKYMLKQRAVKPIIDLENGEKLILLNPSSKEYLQDLQLEYHNLELHYENFNHLDIFQAILPDHLDRVSSYSSIGHILHLNLNEDTSEYKHLIGQVLLDKIPYAKTVVNKQNVINNTYRFFEMEILAGEENFITKTKEHGCIYELDFSKVYWNPRLSTEHQRLVSELSPTDILYDVFAGIGPFAIPAAKKGCTVLANDLNPESYRWLENNVKINKTKISTYNLDGRDFIKTALKSHLIDIWKTNNKTNIHVAMNLPALAIEFLDEFVGLFSDYSTTLPVGEMPVIHVYGFGITEQDVLTSVISKLPGLQLDDLQLRTVRNVAPNKNMFLIKFKLLKSILFRSDFEEPPTKKKLCSN
ncbi:DgyrCDS10871 [Dimorphilus gyrociliatus]|nr:DgyrCDS10871 [Dimorphilus gyrociliatus]